MTTPNLSKEDIIRKIYEYEDKNGLPRNSLRALIEQESGYNPQVVSHAGAKGLGQLMDATAQSLGVTDSFDIDQNLTGASKYFATLLDQYGGDVTKAWAAYNTGPGNLNAYLGGKKGLHPETANYVPRVLNIYERLSKEKPMPPIPQPQSDPVPMPPKQEKPFKLSVPGHAVPIEFDSMEAAQSFVDQNPSLFPKKEDSQPEKKSFLSRIFNTELSPEEQVIKPIVDQYKANPTPENKKAMDEAIFKLTSQETSLGKVGSALKGYTGGIGGHVENLADYARSKLSGQDLSYSDIQEINKEVDSKNGSTLAELGGMFLPGSVLNRLIGGASKVVGGASKIPYLGRVLQGPFMQGAATGALSSVGAGQISEDLTTGLERRLDRSKLDAIVGGVLGGTLNKVGSMVSNKIQNANAKSTMEQIYQKLDDELAYIKDPVKRSEIINDTLNAWFGRETGRISQLGGVTKKALRKEMNTSSQWIKDFYKQYTKGNATPVTVKNARDYLQRFFQENKLMNEAGQWINDMGNVIKDPQGLYGAGQLTESQQGFLFKRFLDFYKNPTLQRLDDIRKTIQKEAFGGQQPLFGKGDPIIKGLSNALKTDEEQAIKALYGEDVLKDFLKRKETFKTMADATKGIARRLGLMNDSGQFVINKDPEKFIKALSGLTDDELSKLYPILQKHGVDLALPGYDALINRIQTLKGLGNKTDFSGLAKNLADNPKLRDAFKLAGREFSPEAMQNIKGDFFNSLVEKASKGGKMDVIKLTELLGSIDDSVKSMIFTPQQMKAIEALQKLAPQATKAGSFLSRILGKAASRAASKAPGGRMVYDLVSNIPGAALQEVPQGVVNSIIKTGEGLQKAAPRLGPATRRIQKEL